MTNTLTILLTAISASSGNAESRTALQAYLAQLEDLAPLLSRAVATKALGFIGPMLMQCCPPQHTGKLKEILSDYLTATMLRSRPIIQTTVAIANRLREVGIAFVIIKGPIQQHSIYGEYFSRPCSDVDVLVPAADYRRAISTLCAALDVRVVNHSPFLWWDLFVGERHLVEKQGASRSIDLHYRVQAPGTAQPRATRAFIDSAVQHRVAGVDVPALSPQYVPLLCAMSIVKALRRRELAATHACDLFLTMQRMPSLQKRAVWQLAQDQGLEGTLDYALKTTMNAFVDIENPGREARMLFDPDSFADWPPVLDLLDLSTQGPHASRLRERLWYEASELSRKLERVVKLTGRALRNPRD